MRGDHPSAHHGQGRRGPPPGIPRPIRLGGYPEQGGERGLRLAQRDPAPTQRLRLHDATSCHRRRPPGSAGVGLGVLQSANLWGRPVTVFACTFAPGAQAVGTIGEFFRKLARQAGFEPATLGLEGPTSESVINRRLSPTSPRWSGSREFTPILATLRRFIASHAITDRRDDHVNVALPHPEPTGGGGRGGSIPRLA